MWKWFVFCLAVCSAFGVEISCPAVSAWDEAIDIVVTDLDDGELVAIELSWIDQGLVTYESRAVFRVGSDGSVHLSSQAPVYGSYDGVDGMGLFWSMRSTHVTWMEEGPWNGPHLLMELKVIGRGRELARKELQRVVFPEDLYSECVLDGSLIGELFLPSRLEEAMPLVVVLAGSEGGLCSAHAAAFASHGLPALALAYSGIGNLPPRVEGVQMEYFEEAFQWMCSDGRFSGEVYLHGTSRGAELALLLGSLYPDHVHKIVAVAPSCVVLSRDSWIYGDAPILPAAPYFIDLNNDSVFEMNTRETPRSIRIHRERGFFLEREKLEAARIPVEQIRCPVLLISGGDDQLGPSSMYAEMAAEQMVAPVTHLDYPEAGHFISVPYMPRENVIFGGDEWLTVGGTPAADEAACRDSWAKTLDFFLNP